MIEINLLPSGASRRAPAARSLARRGVSLPKVGGDPRVAGLGLAGLLFLVLAAFGFWRTGEAQGRLSAEVEREAADSLRLARTLALLETLEARRDTVEQKIGVIQNVDGRRYVWPHLLDEISRATPQFTWLTKVAVVEEEEAPRPAAPANPADTAKARADSAAAAAQAALPRGPVFNLEGNAGSTQALTRFMKNLEASPMIRGVTLVTSEQTQSEGRVYQKFTLEARWEEPDSALIQTVPVVTLQ
ncbi:MAG TPA: PilN domain-containing protein [Longimicrobiaceae bacterium]|nr:PilN domain-containing protein [Longimicrobiaceae bacterium]